MNENAEIESRFARDYERRLYPKGRADFDRLFNALEEWRKIEVEKIHSTKSNMAERKAALAILLDKETELIAAIGLKQIFASKTGRKISQEKCLKLAAASKRWKSADDDRPVEMDTVNILHARTLLEIYESLQMDCLSNEERLDLLLTVKKTVRENPCKLSCDIINLVEREANLILRGIHSENLVGLRQRIAHHFVQYTKTPEFNPEIGKYLSVPYPKTKKYLTAIWNDTHPCKSCWRYLRSNEFSAGARSTNLSACQFCCRQSNRGRARHDLEPYRKMLLELRINEAEIYAKSIEDAKADKYQKRLDYLNTIDEDDINLDSTEDISKSDSSSSLSTFTFSESEVQPQTQKLELLVNTEDIHILVHEIWENRSALTSWPDLADLIIVRWHVSQPWSPWNTFIITRKEAELHYGLSKVSLKQIYGDALIERVNQRLLMARNVFGRLCFLGSTFIRQRYLEKMKDISKRETNEKRQEARKHLKTQGKPLYVQTPDERHAPTYQPPKSFLPVLKGYKSMGNMESLRQFDDEPCNAKSN